MRFVADADRLASLADAVATEPGEWTTERAREHHRRAGFNAPYRRTARRDLELLARSGLLAAHCDEGNTFYTRRETRR